MNNQIQLNLTDEKKLQLLKDTICKGSTDDEFQLFAYTCERLGLDPFARQVFPVKRWDSSLKREVMTVQTSIDGYRLIANRTGRYAPGRAPQFKYDKNGNLFSCTAFVKKQTTDGTWHEVEATAFYMEYVARKKDGTPNSMWETKAHIMLSKCAESLALRKAFPMELSGTYTEEEMQQTKTHVDEPIEVEAKPAMSDGEYDAFVDHWSITYDKNALLKYIDRRSHYYKMSANETAYVLSQDQEQFEKEFKGWLSRQDKLLEK